VSLNSDKIISIRDIAHDNDTAQNKINDLEEHINLLQSIINKVPDLISVRDVDGRIILVNEAVEKLYGSNADEIIGKYDKDIRGCPWKTESLIELDTLLIEKTQKKTILEESTIDEKGKKLWLQTTIQPFDTANNEIRLLSISSNITPRRQTQQKLIQSDKRFKDFTEIAANIFWELDENLNYTYISGSIKKLIGSSSVYPLGKNYNTLFSNSKKCELDIDAYQKLLLKKESISNFTFNVKNNNKEIDIFRINAKPIFDMHKQFVGYRGVIRSITEEKALLERIAYDAKHDSLTGLVNRKEFDKQLKRILKKSKDTEEESVLCYLDLDHFKVVNDAAGHSAGDKLLVQLTNILQDKVRSSDIVARLGGDEFGIILESCPLDNAITVCEEILNSIHQFVFVKDHQSFSVSVSIGVAMITNNSSNEAVIMSQADMACYRAKELGRNQMHVAHTDDTAIIERSSEFTYVSAITDAINNDRLFLMKQPIVPINNKEDKAYHYEVLSRILDEKNNIIPPNEFIRIAERYGMITSVDRFVIKKSFQYHMQAHNNDKDVISINLSGNTISDPYILEFIKNEIEKHNINPSSICFEITETAAISSIKKAINIIKDLKEVGVMFALDDFGSGLSSFGYLKDLPVDFLKIDGAFVQNIVNSEKDRAIVKSINEVGKSMGMQTIAEFVENDQILEILSDIGVDYAQGYGIGKPERVE